MEEADASEADEERRECDCDAPLLTEVPDRSGDLRLREDPELEAVVRGEPGFEHLDIGARGVAEHRGLEEVTHLADRREAVGGEDGAGVEGVVLCRWQHGGAHHDERSGRRPVRHRRLHGLADRDAEVGHRLFAERDLTGSRRAGVRPDP